MLKTQNIIKRNVPLLFFITAFITLNAFLVISAIENNNNISNFLRIHVVGATDSIEDQRIKLEVAKNIQDYIASTTCNLEDKSKTNLKQTIIDNIDEILKLTNDTIKKNNRNYTIVANIGNIYYDAKTYNGVETGSGIYDSLQIVLDQGKGQNWWSLIYPYSYECSVKPTNAESSNTITTEDILNSNDTQISFGLWEMILKLFTGHRGRRKLTPPK